MNHSPSTIVRREGRDGKRGALGRVLRGTLYVKAALALLAVLAAGVLYLRLAAGPLSFGSLSSRVESALAQRIGPGWSVRVKDSSIGIENGSLALRTLGLEIRDPEGVAVVRAPFATLSVNTLSLLAASLQPRSIEFRDLQLRATVNPDGSLSFTSGPETTGAVAPPPAGPAREAPPPPSPTPGPERLGPSPLSVTLASLFDLVLEPSGVVGALDRAKVANARLTIVDAEGRERAVFSEVEATFQHAGDAARQFDMRLKGPRGEWRLGGELRRLDGERREGVLTATEVPIQDLLLLSGLSNLPGATDLKVSVRAETALVRGWISRFDARLETGGGVLQMRDKDMPPVSVDAALAETSWDETRRALALKTLVFKGGATDVRLQGEFLAARGGQGWGLTLSGRNAVVSGAMDADRPFTLEDVQASLAGQDEGVVLDRLSLRGPTVSADLSGSYRTAADRGGLHVDIHARGLEARSALRLWPDTVTTKIRRYLVETLKAGTADTLDVRVALSERDLAQALAGGPVPDETLRVDLAVRDGELAVADGLPSLSQAQVSGTITGTKAVLRATGGRAEMPDGRSLTLSEGTFAVPDFWADPSVAKVAFRLGGGADALGSFLQTPLLRTVQTLDLDPAAIKGRADLRVAIPLPLQDMPKFVDLPIAVTGTVNDLSIDKAFGKSGLEGANLTIAYDKASLWIRGEGKAGGTPVTLDVRQPHAAPGEAVATLVLDDAARARKGLSFGTQLTGPVPVRVVLPLGRPGRGGARVEADLTRAGVNELLPGWTKPAGKPGKLSFTCTEDKGFELRDLALDSGPVQLRGSASLTPDGSLEKADLSTVKLSPGDDMRAQIERLSGTYRVTVRGNMVDARPFAKGLIAGTPAKAKTHIRSQAPVRDQRDVDLDGAVNILAGFNDEALTNVSLKASVRGGDLQYLQLNGRFRTASVAVRTVSQQGTPILALQSQDAGATLRFLDIYRRMTGGELALQAALGSGVQTGSLALHGFSLRDEPALRRIIAQQPLGGDDHAGGALAPRISSGEVEFSKARADFSRTAGRLEFRNAVIWGTQIGFTLNGWIDYVRDRTDISGTFVPAYGLNNVFAQVPLFGPLLGGGRNEGLFAVNFRVSGAASAPTLTVNPLSAIAPGFLRKLFGAGPADEPAFSALPPYGER